MKIYMEDPLKKNKIKSKMEIPDLTMATSKDLENLVALTSAQLSLLPLILSLIFIRYKISFKMMLQPLILMRFLPSYPRS